MLHPCFGMEDREVTILIGSQSIVTGFTRLLERCRTLGELARLEDAKKERCEIRILEQDPLWLPFSTSNSFTWPDPEAERLTTLLIILLQSDASRISGDIRRLISQSTNMHFIYVLDLLLRWNSENISGIKDRSVDQLIANKVKELKQKKEESPITDKEKRSLLRLLEVATQLHWDETELITSDYLALKYDGNYHRDELMTLSKTVLISLIQEKKKCFLCKKPLSFQTRFLIWISNPLNVFVTSSLALSLAGIMWKQLKSFTT